MGPQMGWLGAGHAAATGFVSGAIASGDVKGGLQGAFSGAVFFGIGQAANSLAGKGSLASNSGAWSNGGIGRAAMHAAGGCVTTVVGGGKCGTGAAAAGFGKLINSNLSQVDNEMLGTMRAAIVGGTISTIGGGKFSNGAQTGAFQYIFNHMITHHLAQNYTLDFNRPRISDFFKDLFMTAGDKLGECGNKVMTCTEIISANERELNKVSPKVGDNELVSDRARKAANELDAQLKGVAEKMHLRTGTVGGINRQELEAYIGEIGSNVGIAHNYLRVYGEFPYQTLERLDKLSGYKKPPPGE